MRFLLIVLTALLGFESVRAEDTEAKPAAAGQGISIEVLIVETATKPGDGGQELNLTGTAEEVQRALGELERSGRLAVLDRVRLRMLDGQQTTVQVGGQKSVATGRQTLSAFLRERREDPPRTTTVYQMQQVGTVVNATASVREDGLILVELQVEKTRLASSAADAGGEADADAPIGTVTAVLRTTVGVPQGEPVLVGGMASKDDRGRTSQLAVLLTANVIGENRRGAAGDERQIRVFTLNYAQSAEVVKTLQDVFADYGPSQFSTDARTNTVIVTGDTEFLDNVQALLIRLDEALAKPE